MSNELKRSGICLCLCGPAGVGKSVIAGRLLEQFGAGLGRSVSYTSRAPRAGEKDGQAYHFVSAEKFKQLAAQGTFFEWEQVHSNFYGTPQAEVDGVSGGERDLLLVIDIKGALRFKSKLPQSSVVVFLLPPSSAELARRMQERGALPPAEMQARLATWRAEARIVDEHRAEIDYLVLNSDLDQTFIKISAILQAERSRCARVQSDTIKRIAG